ncbi:MAG: type II methionyl aminopeptidase [Candidatus Paceibacterota bacterium]|jgi:methionyl aminopeptidase
MNEDINIDDFRNAGKMAARIREESKKLIMPGESILDIAETIEKMIYDEGGRPAFPVNVSLNSIAAHYTPESNTKELLGEEDVVKIDIGVDIHGGIGDTAYTIDLSEKNKSLVQASEEALNSAIEFIKPGAKIGDIGGVIEERIKSFGFKPVSNLTGHKITTGLLHSGIDVPNVKTTDPYEVQEGEIYAIEPFASTGSGFVSDLDQVEIFSLYSLSPVKMRQSRQILNHIIGEYELLPFSERWLNKKFPSRLSVSAALKELLREQVIRAYPVLKDSGDGLVSQAEHTILVLSDGVEILTK